MENNEFKYERFDLQKAIDKYGGTLCFDEGFSLLFEHIQCEFERYLKTLTNK